MSRTETIWPVGAGAAKFASSNFTPLIGPILSGSVYAANTAMRQPCVFNYQAWTVRACSWIGATTCLPTPLPFCCDAEGSRTLAALTVPAAIHPISNIGSIEKERW